MILNLIKSPSRRTSDRERLMNICARIPGAGLARTAVIIILAATGDRSRARHARTLQALILCYLPTFTLNFGVTSVICVMNSKLIKLFGLLRMLNTKSFALLPLYL